MISAVLRRHRFTLCSTALLLSLHTGAAIVVESTQQGYRAHGAGIEAGDRLAEWRFRDSAGRDHAGAFDTPFDVGVVSRRAHGVPVLVLGKRDGEAREWRIEPGVWWMEARPAYAEPYLQRYRAASSDDDQNSAKLRQLADELERDGRALQAAWTLMRVSSRLRAGGASERAARTTRRAAKLAREAGSAEAAAQILEKAGREHGNRSQLERSIEFLRAGLAVRRDSGDMPIAVSSDLRNLGIAHTMRSDYKRARQVLRESMTLLGRHAPASLLLAEALHTLGNVEFQRGDLDAARSVQERALKIREQLVPGTQDVARSLHVLANVHWRSGRLQRAQDMYKRARELLRANDAQPMFIAQATASIGFVAHDRRDLVAAERHYRQALEVFREVDGDRRLQASVLMALGNTARARRDLDAAETYIRQSLEISRNIAPESQPVALALGNLAAVAQARGDLDRAESLNREAIEQLQSYHADSALLPSFVSNLARIYRERGDHDRARATFEDALERSRALNPESVDVAVALEGLGRVAMARGDHRQATAHFGDSLRLATRLVPGTVYHAKAAHGLGLSHWRRGNLDTAREYLAAAVKALEAQTRQIGGDVEARAAFTAGYAAMHRDYMLLLIETGDPLGAFEAYERYRNARLREMLAERGVQRRASVDRELLQRKERLDYEYQQLYETIRAGETDDDARAAQIERLQALRLERRGARAGIEAAVGAVSLPREPAHPSALPEKTALLAYAVFDKRTLVFAAARDQVPVIRELPIERDSLADAVERVRVLIQQRPGQTNPAHMKQAAGELYQRLVRPVEATLGDAERILLVADGPLQPLPFGALVTSATGEPARYWIEHAEIQRAPSLTVWRALNERRNSEAQGIAVFAAADVATAEADGSTRRESHTQTSRLPFARREAHALGELFDREARLYLGESASESAFKGSTDAAIIHLAMHARTDPIAAMDSHLLLTPGGGQENGVLHAWEVFEQIELDADLVTLSACSTAARDKTGVLGLSWAFQAAGARNVVATLWPVADHSTSLLMQHFYRRIKAGAAPATALRRAQLELLNGRAQKRRGLIYRLRSLFGDDTAAEVYRHPYYWAGFLISGAG